MKYCGIDLHSNNSVVIVSDEEDRIVLSKRLPNNLGQIGAVLEPYRDELAGVVVESTYNWYWLGVATNSMRERARLRFAGTKMARTVYCIDAIFLRRFGFALDYRRLMGFRFPTL
jgi:hypothetical protein